MQLSEYVSTKFNSKRPTSIIQFIKKNDTALAELITETSFLNDKYNNPTIQQRLFHYINKIDQVVLCEVCGNPAAIKLKNARITSEKPTKKLASHYRSTCNNLECQKKINVLKSEEGMMNLYGVTNISHIKISFKPKLYTFPSGKIATLQGYEPIAIDILLKTYNENDILVESKEIEYRIGKIIYNANGKLHRYYPDVYIISENNIVEVKSKYTYLQNLEINNLKQNACINAGFNFEFMILSKNLTYDRLLFQIAN